MLASDPSGRSPAQVSKDPAYETMYDYNGNGYYTSVEEVVVKHKDTGTFWRTSYAVSNCEVATHWHQVIRQQVSITRYVLKRTIKAL